MEIIGMVQKGVKGRVTDASVHHEVNSGPICLTSEDKHKYNT